MGMSKITNGTRLLPNVDGRSGWARRFHDLTRTFISDIGGPDGLSGAQIELCRRAGALSVELERMETRWAKNEGAKAWELEAFGRSSNSLRRLFECLGITRGRIARPVESLEDYLAKTYSGTTVDADADAQVSEAAE